MKREHKERWLEALRSGRYTQGERCLHKVDREGKNYHCCLGVAADIFHEEFHVIKSQILDRISYRDHHIYYGTAHLFLPPEMTHTLSLSPEVQKDLTDMNDLKRLSFNEIADWIEANVPEDSDSETETNSEDTSRD